MKRHISLSISEKLGGSGLSSSQQQHGAPIVVTIVAQNTVPTWDREYPHSWVYGSKAVVRKLELKPLPS